MSFYRSICTLHEQMPTRRANAGSRRTRGDDVGAEWIAERREQRDGGRDRREPGDRVEDHRIVDLPWELPPRAFCAAASTAVTLLLALTSRRRRDEHVRRSQVGHRMADDAPPAPSRPRVVKSRNASLMIGRSRTRS